MKSYLGEYESFITSFLERGYKIIPLGQYSGSKKNEMLLRHDVDFDCSLAHKISDIEHKLGIKASYFFMLRSNSYNLLSGENIDYVKSIQEKGHEINIHFDPGIYSDFREGFEMEKNIFESAFKTKIEVASLHRPNDFFLNYDKPIQGIEHTYQKKFFGDIKYISDSRGTFRFGHPFDAEEWKNNDSIHLLIHPVWWSIDGGSPVDSLKKFITLRGEKFDNHVADSCIPYREYLDSQK